MEKLFIVFGTGATKEYFYTGQSDCLRRHINVEFVSVENLEPLGALNAVNKAIAANGSKNVSRNIVFYVGDNLQFLPKNLKCPCVDMLALRNNFISATHAPDSQQEYDIVSIMFSGAVGKCLQESDD